MTKDIEENKLLAFGGVSTYWLNNPTLPLTHTKDNQNKSNQTFTVLNKKIWNANGFRVRGNVKRGDASSAQASNLDVAHQKAESQVPVPSLVKGKDKDLVKKGKITKTV